MYVISFHDANSTSTSNTSIHSLIMIYHLTILVAVNNNINLSSHCTSSDNLLSYGNSRLSSDDASSNGYLQSAGDSEGLRPVVMSISVKSDNSEVSPAEGPDQRNVTPPLDLISKYEEGNPVKDLAKLQELFPEISVFHIVDLLLVLPSFTSLQDLAAAATSQITTIPSEESP